MKNKDRSELPLREKPASGENDREKQRQRLADLIGKLLARYWLKSLAPIQDSQSDSQTSEGE